MKLACVSKTLVAVACLLFQVVPSVLVVSADHDDGAGPLSKKSSSLRREGGHARELQGGPGPPETSSSFDLIAGNKHCQKTNTNSIIELGSKGNHGFGFTLDGCAEATEAEARCQQGFFYYSKTNDGQCKCATDACTTKASSTGYNIYQIRSSAGSSSSKNTIKVLFSNTHLFYDSLLGLDSSSVYLDFERRDELLKRAKEGNYDILGFSEVWADSQRDFFATKLPPPIYQTYIPHPDVSWLQRTVSASSGLVLSANGDISNAGFYHWEGMVGPGQFAYKGVAYGLVRVKEDTLVGWVQTHAQASYDGTEKRDAAARKKQMVQTLFPAMKKVQEMVNGQGPTILMGDLNIVGESAEYNWFQEEVGKLGFVDCWLETNPSDPGYTYEPAKNMLVKKWDSTQTTPQRLDYVYMSPGVGGEKCAEMKILRDWKTTDGVSMSDHEAVEVVIDLNGGTKTSPLPPSLPTKHGNGHECTKSSMCTSNCCSSTLFGADTCETDHWSKVCT